METKTIEWRGLNVEVIETCDPASEPWDGEGPLDPDDEGWDLAVEVSVTVDGHEFRAGDSIGGCWIHPDAEGRAYINSQLKEITDEALKSLGKEIARVASGEDVERAIARKLVATVMSGLPA
jgi:hypothetical protein